MNKRRLKELLYGFEIRSMAIICNGIVNKTPKQVILRDLKKDLMLFASRIRLSDDEITGIWSEKTREYARISKETFREMRVSERKFGKKEQYDEYIAYRKAAVYDSVHKYWPNLEKNKNEIADRVEFRVKNQEYRDILYGNSVFYLCNWFDDCAKDHVPYQGKVYVADDWENLVPDSEADAIRAYIKNHKVMTVYEVTQNAPWLTTRRNCRHRLYPIPVEEVMRSSVRSMLKKHGLKHKYENEYNCVLTQKKITYIKYYERLKGLLYLKKMFDTPDLDADIKNARKLMLKYK